MDKTASCDNRGKSDKNQSAEGTDSVCVHITISEHIQSSKLRVGQACCLSLSAPGPFRDLSAEGYPIYVSYENILHQKSSSNLKLNTKKCISFPSFLLLFLLTKQIFLVSCFLSSQLQMFIYSELLFSAHFAGLGSPPLVRNLTTCYRCTL